MGVSVRIPTPLRKLTEGKSEVEANGGNVGEIIDNLESSYPGLKEKLCEENGSVRKFLNIYLNDEDIRFMDSLATEVREGDTLALIPAIAGGK
ncbi:MAG: MoaD/ThiS family protein [Deltaproteobacteria bacterium]|nr:MoaD/ThiS family protein [Deltaproteobacteria bacterium]